MSEFIKSFRKAEKLVASSQNRENSLALIGTDTYGNEGFLQWVTAKSLVNDLKVNKGIVKLRIKAGTIG